MDMSLNVSKNKPAPLGVCLANYLATPHPRPLSHVYGERGKECYVVYEIVELNTSPSSIIEKVKPEC
jgi:hypothetical protein